MRASTIVVLAAARLVQMEEVAPRSLRVPRLAPVRSPPVIAQLPVRAGAFSALGSQGAVREASRAEVTEQSAHFGPVAVSEDLAGHLAEAGYVHPMAIQRAAMPLIAEGKSVVLHAATGSGKTLAFLVPLLARLGAPGAHRALVVTPSQELAVQIAAEASRLLEGEARSSRVLLAISSSRETELEQQDALASRVPRLVVGTPQRLAELCAHADARPVLRGVDTVVLDEVDLLLPPQLLARGRGASVRGRGAPARERRAPAWGRGAAGQRAAPPVQRLARPRPTELVVAAVQRSRPRGAPLQLVSSSATISPDLRRRVAALLGRTAKKEAGVLVTTEPAHPPPRGLKKFGVGGVQMPSTIRHSAYVGRPEGLEQMLQLAFEELAPERALLVLPNGASVPALVERLRGLGYDAVALHEALGVPRASESEPRVRPAKGDSLQAAMVRKRQELESVFARRTPAPLLVTTEHSAHGIDFKDVDVVFLVGLPQRRDSYIHVAGRTAREGRKGRAVTLVTDDEEAARLDAFGRELGIVIEKVDVRFLKGN